MAENIGRSGGRPKAYTFGRGGAPIENGPYIGMVKNNIDPTRAGRLQVLIDEFAGIDPEDPSNWRVVNYLPPFYGSTEHSGTDADAGNFVGNRHTYGMWFTPPDVGTNVMCFFVSGDPSRGYYVGCVPEPGLSHMVPAIGASTKFNSENASQKTFFKNSKQLPVTEINNKNAEISEDSRFFDKPKPIHSVLAGAMFQQGIINDLHRGPIGSNSQRESPSTVYGISTPGKPIYEGGLDEATIKTQLERGELTVDQVKVIGRRGGHTFVMDDGDLEGKDQLLRIRTAKGHQITMSDDGDCFYITHANGQSWLEFGKEGTVDVFSTNSVNIRTQGTINLHADKDINMYAAGKINLSAKIETNIQSSSKLNLSAPNTTIYSSNSVGVLSDNMFQVKAKTGTIDCKKSLNLVASCIGLNSGGKAAVTKVPSIKVNKASDSKYDSKTGWSSASGALETITTRVPTHEPWPYHNLGVENSVEAGGKNPVELLESVSDSIANLDDIIPVGISKTDLLDQAKSLISVGDLDPGQVTGMMAQLAKDVGQPLDGFSIAKGIGKFGLTPEKLESLGVLKPGIVSRFLPDPSALVTDYWGNTKTQFESVLSNANAWTGKMGANSLDSLLSNSGLQDKLQGDSYLNALTGLKSIGMLTGGEDANALSAMVQSAAVYGTDNVASWVNGSATAELAALIEQTGRNAQFAVTAVEDTYFGTADSVESFTDTFKRNAIDAEQTLIVGNDKVKNIL